MFGGTGNTHWSVEHLPWLTHITRTPQTLCNSYMWKTFVNARRVFICEKSWCRQERSCPHISFLKTRLSVLSRFYGCSNESHRNLSRKMLIVSSRYRSKTGFNWIRFSTKNLDNMVIKTIEWGVSFCALKSFFPGRHYTCRASGNWCCQWIQVGWMLGWGRDSSASNIFVLP